MQMEVCLCKRTPMSVLTGASVPWMPRDLEKIHNGSSNFPISLLSLLWLGEAMVCLMHFVVWVAIGGSFFVHTYRCCVNQFFST